VFATLHTNSAAQTIDRIIDSFPEEQQQQIRIQLSASLEAVLSQRLIPTKEGKRMAATEVMVATPAVRNLIREGKTHQIDNVIMTSAEMGMFLLETSLADLVNQGLVDKEAARAYAIRPSILARLIGT
jgi:twitching motility protein PilT